MSKLYSKGVTEYELGKRFGLSQNTVRELLDDEAFFNQETLTNHKLKKNRYMEVPTQIIGQMKKRDMKRLHIK